MTTTQELTANESLIRLRAYERWKGRGCPDGSDLEDWLAAEQELSHVGADIVKRKIEKANIISAAFPYQKQRRRVLGSEMAYVEVGEGDRVPRPARR